MQRQRPGLSGTEQSMTKPNAMLLTVMIGCFFIFTNASVEATTERGLVMSKIVDKLGHGKKRALVIGINAYQSMPLEAAVADAQAVTKRLQELNFEVTTVLDQDATIMRLRSELGTKLSQSGENDQVVIYFAGHGITEKLPGGKVEGYILPVDVNLRDVYATAISMKELRDLTSRIPAKHLVYVFDSCYSGLGLTRSVKNGLQEPDFQVYMENMAGQRAVYLISAGKADEVAREVGGHGLFTMHFLDGIAGAADQAPQDGIVQASELGAYLASAVSRDTDGSQNPQHGLLEGDGDFLFPLQDDDPIRLRQSMLAKLTMNATEFMRRKTLQDQFNQIQDNLKQSAAASQDSFSREIAKLDEQIKAKQAEIEKLNKEISSGATVNLNQQSYSKMKFPNTGLEFDVLEVFPNFEACRTKLNEVFGITGQNQSWTPEIWGTELRDSVRNGIVGRLKAANPYQSKVPSYIGTAQPNHLQRKGFLRGKGVVNDLYITLFSPRILVKNITKIPTTMKNDQSIFIRSIVLYINDIDSNDKLLTFDMLRDRLVARYGPATSLGEGFSIKNWKTGNRQKRQEHFWEDDSVKLVLNNGNGCSGDSDQLGITLYNKTPIFQQLIDQACKIFEAEEFVLLKERIEAMAETERQQAEKAKAINF